MTRHTRHPRLKWVTLLVVAACIVKAQWLRIAIASA